MSRPTVFSGRILIADDVGLGKTVQAGLLLAEMAGERSGFRALVLVPASLRDQWAQELQLHFSISVTAADAAWLRHTARAWPAHVNPNITSVASAFIGHRAHSHYETGG